MSFVHYVGDRYVVTGVTVDNKRFKIETTSPQYALGINLFRGSVWRIKSGQSKRIRIKSVWN